MYLRNPGTKCKWKPQHRDFYFLKFQTGNGILLLPRIKSSCCLPIFWTRTIDFPSVSHSGLNMCKTFDILFHTATQSVSHHFFFPKWEVQGLPAENAELLRSPWTTEKAGFVGMTPPLCPHEIKPFARLLGPFCTAAHLRGQQRPSKL